MKKYLIAIILSWLAASASYAQDPALSDQAIWRTIVIDISVIDFNHDAIEDVERGLKDRARLNKLIAEKKARSVMEIQVRARSKESSSARVGQRVPIQSSTSPQGMPQIQYENTGLNVDVSPVLLSGDQIEIKLRIELSGAMRGAGSLSPVFFQRTFSDNVLVKQGETSVLLSVIQHELLWPSSPAAPNVEGSQGNFAVLLTARIAD